MILGIGTDIVNVARMEAALQRHGEKFARRLLAISEWGEYQQSTHAGRFLAKRFAAKEALAKACSTGLRHPVGLQAIKITHDALGKPAFDFDAGLADFLRVRGVVRHHLSISDEHEMALAFVILEGET
jgi:holo-[acyl-carrier protein] synthase